jgi:hypothetical protein
MKYSIWNNICNYYLKYLTMLQLINDLPAHVVGVHAIGKVTVEDYETVLIPRLDELAKQQGNINYLLVLETDVSNFTFAAWWRDLKLGLKHYKEWRKIAIVTDQKGVEWFSDIFCFFIPGRAKGFPLTKLDEAVMWVSKV